MLMVLARTAPKAAASNAGFVVLFAIFVVGMLVLIFLTMRYVIRRDKAGRQAWLERQVERQAQATRASPPPQRKKPGAPPARKS